MMRGLDSTSHVQDDALLLLLEGELQPHDTLCVEQHLQRCNHCRLRLHLMHSAEAQLSPAPVQALPSAAAARARLAAGLQVLEKPNVLAWKAALHPSPWLRIAAVAALCVVAVTFRQVTRPLQDLMAAYEETGPKPDHALTPGSASPLSVAQVCERRDDDLDPKVPRETQQAVFRAYRLDDRRAKAYQVDYLINPQLGGDSSLQNLWPEPYHATVWNATAKDALETRLHGMVCSGQLDLHAAQQELATDWIAAYKKYFHASRPVSTMATR